MFVSGIVVIFSLFCSSSYACNRNENCAIDESNEIIMGLLASMDDFTTQMIQKFMYNENSKMNAVISPFSAYVLIVLILFGSKGDTQTEIITALNFPTADMQKIRVSFGDIIIMTDRKQSKNVLGKEYIMVEGCVKPGIFLQTGSTLIPDYATYFDLLHFEAHHLDFANKMSAATDAINRWIEEMRPKGDLPPLLYTVNENTRMYLTSFFYFTAKWKENIFMDIAPGLVPFQTLNNGAVDVTMMRTQSSLFYYDKVDAYRALEVPFEGDDFTAIYIVPYKDPATFATTFTMAIVEEFLTNGAVTDVDCQVPIISYEYALELSAQLQEWGINLLFGEADLSNMFDLPVQNFGVQMAHTSEIIINELGAMPEAIIGIKVVPKDPLTGTLTPFVADTPFMLLIRSNHSRVIVLATFFYQP